MPKKTKKQIYNFTPEEALKKFSSIQAGLSVDQAKKRFLSLGKIKLLKNKIGNG